MQISSESVKVGHPDIVADMIAANIIATILDREHKKGMDINTMPHCGIEVFLGKGLCVVGGEVSTRAWIDLDKCVRETVLGPRLQRLGRRPERQLPRGAQRHHPPVARHQHRHAGRRRQAQGDRRRRPGDHVRLRLRRDPGAPPAHLRPRQPDDAGLRELRRSDLRPGRQGPGLGGLRRQDGQAAPGWSRS